MRYTFHIVDVFSASLFGGNQLAVLPEAAGISSEGMQKIAREFNFAEATFVLPKNDPAATCRLRIFTPKAEVDFAGHPTIGTACALVMEHRDATCDPVRLILEENVGPVLVEVARRDEVFCGTLTRSGKIDLPAGAPSAADVAAVLSLSPAEVSEVFFAGVGLPFCFAQLRSKESVDRAVIDRSAWAAKLSPAWSPHLFFFAGDLQSGGELHARMCAPALGIDEDPATGSACAALVGAMALRSEFAGEAYRLSIQQVVAMGRRSDIEAIARKSGEVVSSISVGGATAQWRVGRSRCRRTCWVRRSRIHRRVPGGCYSLTWAQMRTDDGLCRHEPPVRHDSALRTSNRSGGLCPLAPRSFRRRHDVRSCSVHHQKRKGFISLDGRGLVALQQAQSTRKSNDSRVRPDGDPTGWRCWHDDDLMMRDCVVFSAQADEGAMSLLWDQMTEFIVDP